jgi:hypothetical protein
MGGGGAMTTMVSVRLEAGGYGTVTIGIVATAYFTSLMLGSVWIGRVIPNVGHIRT